MFQTVDTDFSPGDDPTPTMTPTNTPLFQTVDTDFSPGDRSKHWLNATLRVHVSDR